MRAFSGYRSSSHAGMRKPASARGIRTALIPRADAGHGRALAPSRPSIGAAPAQAGAASSAASHVGWCWDGIACETGKFLR